MHRDIVADFPPDSIPLASTTLCPVQGMYVPKKYITVQGHPEFTAEIVSEVVNVRHNAKVFSDEMFEDAMSRVNLDHDGVKIASAFLNFLHE
jgi:GMP synthase-like glutamine amidotransferase